MVLELGRATWTEVDEALRNGPPGRRAAILPIGATEAHGPHLALTTDVTIALAMARAGAERLAAEGWLVLILPALPFAPVTWAGALAGSVGPSSDTFTRLVVELLETVQGWGVDVVAIANSHFDPAAVGALRQAVEVLENRGTAIAYPDLTRRRLAERLGEEFRSGACHAGSYETSIMLAEAADHVRQEVAAALPARDQSLTAAMAAGATSFADIGAPDAWVGRPGEASAAEGSALIRELGKILADAIVQRGL
jgi:creatinine amidohydrolase